MNRRFTLIGTNGDEISLSGDPYRTAPDVEQGSPILDVATKWTHAGRRIESSRHDRLLTQLAVYVLADNPDAHDTARERLIDALVSQPDKNVVLISQRSGGHRRALTGRCVSDSFGRVTRSDATWSEVPIAIEAAERPFYVNLEAKIRDTQIGVEGGTLWTGEQPLNADIPLDWDWSLSGRFIADAEAQTITIPNEGAIDTWAEWVLDGPALTLELSHERTGIVTRWEGALLAGETLRILTDPYNRDITHGVETGWAGEADDSEMSPILNGDNRVRIAVTGGAIETTRVRSITHDRYSSA